MSKCEYNTEHLNEHLKNKIIRNVEFFIKDEKSEHDQMKIYFTDGSYLEIDSQYSCGSGTELWYSIITED